MHVLFHDLHQNPLGLPVWPLPALVPLFLPLFCHQTPTFFPVLPFQNSDHLALYFHHVVMHLTYSDWHVGLLQFCQSWVGSVSVPLPYSWGGLLDQSQKSEECETCVLTWGSWQGKRGCRMQCVQKRLWTLSCCLQFQMHLWWLWHVVHVIMSTYFLFYKKKKKQKKKTKHIYLSRGDRTHNDAYMCWCQLY